MKRLSDPPPVSKTRYPGADGEANIEQILAKSNYRCVDCNRSDPEVELFVQADATWTAKDGYK